MIPDFIKSSGRGMLFLEIKRDVPHGRQEDESFNIPPSGDGDNHQVSLLYKVYGNHLHLSRISFH